MMLGPRTRSARQATANQRPSSSARPSNSGEPGLRCDRIGCRPPPQGLTPHVLETLESLHCTVLGPVLVMISQPYSCLEADTYWARQSGRRTEYEAHTTDKCQMPETVIRKINIVG